MSVVTFTNNVQITARSAFQVSQAIAYTTYTAGVIARSGAAQWGDDVGEHEISR